MKKSSDQSNAIQQMENRLGTGFLEAAAEEGERAIVQHVLSKLQEEMEIISLTVKRRHEALQKSTSKYACSLFIIIYMYMIMCSQFKF